MKQLKLLFQKFLSLFKRDKEAIELRKLLDECSLLLAAQDDAMVSQYLSYQKILADYIIIISALVFNNNCEAVISSETSKIFEDPDNGLELSSIYDENKNLILKIGPKNNNVEL